MAPESSPDVAIVGAGVVGCAAAAYLAEAGLRVTVYERSAVGAGASGRNSGLLQAPEDGALAGLYEASLREYRALLELTEPVGALVVAAEASELAGGATVLAGEELRALEPALAPDLVACRLEMGYAIPPAAATRAWAERAGAVGARFEIGEAAALAVEGLRVAGHFAPAGAVLVAAGPWTPEVVDPSGAWRPIVPLWGVVAEVRLDAPPRHALQEPGIGGPSRESRFSMVTAGGASSVGATFLPDPPDPDAVAPLLLQRGARYVPALGDAPLVSTRACARPQSFDGRPLLGPVPGVERLFVAAGHGPEGISLGPGSARLVADAILGRGAIPAGLAAARAGTVGE